MQTPSRSPFAKLALIAPALCIAFCLLIIFGSTSHEAKQATLVSLWLPPVLALIFASASLARLERSPRLLIAGVAVSLLPALWLACVLAILTL